MAAEPPSAAAPLAVADPSVSDAEVRLNAPFAEYASGAMNEREIERCRLIATAAATLIGPALVDAEGVLSASPSPSPPLADDVVSACVRSSEICSSTPPAGASGSPSSGAPADDAVADVVEVELVDAAIVSVPSVLMELSEYASATWFAMLSASARPIAAVAPSVSPCAVVFAD